MHQKSNLQILAPAYLRNAPKFRKMPKKCFPSNIEGPLLVKKKIRVGRGWGGQLVNFKWQVGPCNISLKRSHQNKNFGKKCFGLQWLLKNMQAVSEVKASNLYHKCVQILRWQNKIVLSIRRGSLLVKKISSWEGVRRRGNL